MWRARAASAAATTSRVHDQDTTLAGSVSPFLRLQLNCMAIVHAERSHTCLLSPAAQVERERGMLMLHPHPLALLSLFNIISGCNILHFHYLGASQDSIKSTPGVPRHKICKRLHRHLWHLIEQRGRARVAVLPLAVCSRLALLLMFNPVKLQHSAAGLILQRCIAIRDKVLLP